MEKFKRVGRESKEEMIEVEAYCPMCGRVGKGRKKRGECQLILFCYECLAKFKIESDGLDNLR